MLIICLFTSLEEIGTVYVSTINPFSRYTYLNFTLPFPFLTHYLFRKQTNGHCLYPSLLERTQRTVRLLQKGKEPCLKSLLAFREISFRGYRCQKRIIKCVETRKSLEIFLFVLMLVSKHFILVLFYHFCCIVETTIKITTFISILIVISIAVATLHINKVELKIMYIRHTITTLIVL